jgi:predicted HicB family RNase H-like nuclease
MRKSAQYLKIVEWSEEDNCFVGRCPELMFGGVHGKNEQKVFTELCGVIDEWVEQARKEGDELPTGMSGKRYSGKFNLRLDKNLHERLAIEAVKQGKSLNAYCAEALENEISREQGVQPDA